MHGGGDNLEIRVLDRMNYLSVITAAFFIRNSYFEARYVL